jgi:DNA helicase-2/ATP-dependent DNA helicase PcrA
VLGDILCAGFTDKTMTEKKKKYVLRDDVALPKPEIEFKYRDELNDSQFEAVSALEGPVLVIAGAGSGKTRTLVYRLAYMAERGIRPEEVLLLTFTRRAADEMLRRAATLVSGEVGRIEGGTFHSVGAAILRKYSEAIKYPNNFTILDTADSIELIGRCRSAAGIDFKQRRFPRRQTLQKLFSKAANKEIPLEMIVYDEFPHFVEFIEPMEAIRAEYDKVKANRGMMDFDDLLINLIKLLEQNEGIRQKLQRQYRYIMVDEYQDTNPMQDRIVQLLAGKQCNVMVVGDDSQSIYAFRGADFRNILEFPDRFPGTRIIKLEINYRSTQQILDVANTTIERAVEKHTKILTAARGGGPKPVVIPAENESFQSRFIAQKILEHREEGVELNQMAVLFRSSYLSSDLEIELGRRNIPYVKRGGLRFFESAHVKDLIAHLRLLANPVDEISWSRVLRLIDGVGPATIDNLLGSILADPEPFAALLKTERPRTEAFQRFRTLMADLWRRRESAAPSELLAVAHDYYEPILKDKFDNYPQRIRDIQHLIGISSRYRSLQSFVTDLSIEPQDRFAEVGDEADPDREKLTISTIHSAKGLEWQVVFLIWAIEGRFPSTFSVHRDDQLEEERRLFYVCTTRAKEYLYIVYPINIYDRQMRVMCQPSRFVEELPLDLCDQWDLTEGHDEEDDGGGAVH